MELTIKNYETVLPKELLLQAETNKVRECDELRKGHFVAYVDDKKNTYDVAITVATTNDIVTHSCDCKSADLFCSHKAALLVFITKGKKPKSAVATRKKEGKVGALLDDVELNELKDWLRGVLIKNKDLELAFVHYFSSKKQQYNTEEVAKLVADAIKVVAGNKKNLDATQIKKLVELWTEVLGPVTEYYRANVTDEAAFLCFHTLIEHCNTFQLKMESSSNKIQKFIEAQLQKSVECINVITDEDAWNKAVGYFVSHNLRGTNHVRANYLVHLANITDASGEERKARLVEILAKQFEVGYSTSIIAGEQYAIFIFKLIERHGLFGKYHRLFEPLRYQNEFNIKLIQLLIEIGETSTAEKYCKAQINSNVREDYSIPYLQLLKEIYTLHKDDNKLANILSVLFPSTFDFDDYLFITGRMNEEERKKWRTKMLSRAKNASNNYNVRATEFCFKLMDHEKNYKKMIDYVESHTPYAIILPYFENMLLADRNGLMEAIVRKSDDYGWGARMNSAEKDAACFPELYRIVQRYFPADYFKMVINKRKSDHWYSRINPFLAFVERQLGDVKGS